MATRFQDAVNDLRSKFWPELPEEDRITGWESINEMIKSKRSLAELNSVPRQEVMQFLLYGMNFMQDLMKKAQSNTVKGNVDSQENSQDSKPKLPMFVGLAATFPIINGWKDADESIVDFNHGAPFFYTEKYEKIPSLDGAMAILRSLKWFLLYFIPVSLVNYFVVLPAHFFFNVSELTLRGLGHVFRLLSDIYI